MRYPPYGRHLKENLLEILIFVGDSEGWKKTKHFITAKGNAVLLPLDEDPFSFNWSFTKNIPILVFDNVGISQLTLKKLALILLKCGSPCVRISSPSFEEKLKIFKH